MEKFKEILPLFDATISTLLTFLKAKGIEG